MTEHRTPLRNRRVVVMGLGRFGGGVGVARFLHRQGARVLVTDLDAAARLRESLARLEDLAGIDYRLGEHRESDFTSADLIVVNPAVPGHRDPYVQAARRAGVAVTSEIRLLTERLPQRRRVIGITGSAGKSTVTAMIGHVLEHVGGDPGSGETAARAESNVWVGGNLGGSLLEKLEQIGPDDWVVLELSSFMLEALREARWSPHIAVVTSIAPNHLDWHGSLEAYVQAKQAILDFQGADDVAVLGPGVHGRLTPRTPRVIQPATGGTAALKLLLPGEHNRRNAGVAQAALICAGVCGDAALAALADFPGLPHRLQFVAEHAGVRFFNDSKATTPEAATLAIDSFERGTVHVILGGYDKGSDLGPLARHAAERCRAIYTIGPTGDRIAAAAEATATEADWADVHGPSAGFASCGAAGWRDGSAVVVRCGDLERAVGEAVRRARRGEVVLLAPGCASWGAFIHFEQRGARFVEAVLRWSTETGVVAE